jgi:fumarate reductase subunit D
MAKSNEPFWWALFGAGGMVAALLMPVTILITTLAVSAGWVNAARLYELIQHPLGRLYLFVLIVFPLFHWAHRFRFTLVDLGLKSARVLIAMLCYGAALAGTAAAAAMLFGIWP